MSEEDARRPFGFLPEHHERAMRLQRRRAKEFWRHMMHLGILALLAIMVIVMAVVAFNTARAQVPVIGGGGNQTPSGTPGGGAGDQAVLDGDVWLETWYRHDLQIYRVDPDGIRDSQAVFVRMFYNMSVNVYVANTSTPFHYTIMVDGATLNQGEATWKLHWVTSIPEPTFNMSITISQGTHSKTVSWARIIAVPGDDSYASGGPGVPEHGSTLPATIEIPVNYIASLTWRLLASAAAIMALTFTLVGGVWLEKTQRMGWRRWGMF